MHGRSADLGGDILKLMNSVIHEATVHINDLNEEDPQVAVVNTHDQPEFMHNLLFR